MKNAIKLVTLCVMLISCNTVYPTDYCVLSDGKIIAADNADVVSFSMNKSEEIKLKLRENYSGLNDEEELDDLLQEQNYIEVLKHLWSEKDGLKRCTWLEKKIEEGHPILMFELAEDYYSQDPTLECYLTKAMPWIIAGATRTVLDARCTKDKSCAIVPERLLFTYQQRILSDLLKKYPIEVMEDYVAAHEEAFQKESFLIQKRVFSPFVQCPKHKMPSPRWIFVQGVDSEIPEAQFDDIRKKSAETLLEMFDI